MVGQKLGLAWLDRSRDRYGWTEVGTGLARQKLGLVWLDRNWDWSGWIEVKTGLEHGQVIISLLACRKLK